MGERGIGGVGLMGEVTVMGIEVVLGAGGGMEEEDTKNIRVTHIPVFFSGAVDR